MNPWTLLQQALGYTLAFFYEIIPNYGVAIILLTLVISLLLFPLTLKQTRSMKAMQDIQPEVKALQKELKGDREELNKQLMELYKERGVNPAAGCLPLLLQMPIWFALFQVLRIDGDSVDNEPYIIPPDSGLADALREGDTMFLGLDLLQSASENFATSFGAAIPYLILIAIVIAASYYQQLQTTRRSKNSGQEVTPQAQSMQTVMKIMPLFMGFISWGLPAGLVLYFAVSAMFRIAQQAVILRLDEGRDEGGSGRGGDDPPRTSTGATAATETMSSDRNPRSPPTPARRRGGEGSNRWSGSRRRVSRSMMRSKPPCPN